MNLQELKQQIDTLRKERDNIIKPYNEKIKKLCSKYYLILWRNKNKIEKQKDLKFSY